MGSSFNGEPLILALITFFFVMVVKFTFLWCRDDSCHDDGSHEQYCGYDHKFEREMPFFMASH
jgi:hypothetical protein